MLWAPPIVTAARGRKVAFSDTYSPVRVRDRRANRLQRLCQNRVTYPMTPRAKRRDLRRHADAHECCVKSLIGTALVGFGVRQHAWAGSISKRAPSSTRTSQFRVRQNGRLRAPHELVDRALDQGRRDRRHVPLVLTTWRSLGSLPPPLSLRERARFACARRKAPHRVPQRCGGGGLHDVARHFHSILDESGRSAAWLAHLPWVKSRPNRGRLFRVIPQIPQRIRTLRNR